MQLVIDSNQLQTDTLGSFLRQSKQNRAVLTDFMGIEGYNGDQQGYFRWMDVLSDFPDQVVVLKGSAHAMTQSGRPSGLVRRLLDLETTTKFPDHVAAVRAAKDGRPHAVHQVDELRMYASEHLAKMELDAAGMRPAMDVLGAMYSKEERAIIRARRPYTGEMIAKLTENLFSIAVSLVGPTSRHRSFDNDIKNTFAFRVALAMYVLVLHRTAGSSVKDMSPSRLRNDLVDMTFVAYGSFFDGVMTADNRLIDIYEDSCALLFGLYRVFIVDGFDPFSQLRGAP